MKTSLENLSFVVDLIDHGEGAEYEMCIVDRSNMSEGLPMIDEDHPDNVIGAMWSAGYITDREALHAALDRFLDLAGK